jgi:hypothetical protein
LVCFLFFSRVHFCRSLFFPQFFFHALFVCKKTALSLAYVFFDLQVGTQSTLQAKCLSELAAALDASALGDSVTYLTLLGFLGGTAFWLYRMNEALALFEPLFIIPVLQVFWTFFATLNGGIFFREFMQPAFLERGVGGFALGVGVIFAGVYFLAPPPPPAAGPEASANDDAGLLASPPSLPSTCSVLDKEGLAAKGSPATLAAVAGRAANSGGSVRDESARATPPAFFGPGLSPPPSPLASADWANSSARSRSSFSRDALPDRGSMSGGWRAREPSGELSAAEALGV